MAVTWVWNDRWALITGASSGIGAEFARQLAALGMHLVLVARREERLQQLSQELLQKYGTKTRIIPLDLTAPNACQQLLTRLAENCPPIDLLVNNAGIGQVATIQETDLELTRQLLDLNVRVLTELTYLFLPRMLDRQTGGIIQLASVVAFQPVAYLGAYAASKAYVLHLTEALWAELEKTPVRILAVCPGTTETEFFDQAGVTHWLQRRRAATPQQVVSAAILAFERNQPVCVPGLQNWLTSLLYRLLPRTTLVRESKKIFRHAIRR